MQLCRTNRTSSCELMNDWTIYQVSYQDSHALSDCGEAWKDYNLTPNGKKIQIEHYKWAMVQSREAHLGELGHVKRYLPTKLVHHIPYGVRNDIVQLINR